MIDRFQVQDAYHYALAAAGDGDSQFDPRRTGRTRSDYLRMAYRTALSAGLPFRHTTLGLPPVRRPQSLKDARRLAEDINESARAAGIDANTGEARGARDRRTRRRGRRDPQSAIERFPLKRPGFVVAVEKTTQNPIGPGLRREHPYRYWAYHESDPELWYASGSAMYPAQAVHFAESDVLETIRRIDPERDRSRSRLRRLRGPRIG